MAQRRGFPGRGRKRTMTWGLGPDIADGSASANGTQLWTSSVVLVAEAEVTLVRMRGFFHVTLNTADAIGAGFFGAVGLGLVTTRAVVAGAGSIPRPIQEADWDGWIYHRYWDVRAITATIADGVNAASASIGFEIDSKAMRKWSANESLVGVFEVIESANATCELQAETRLLLKLT